MKRGWLVLSIILIVLIASTYFLITNVSQLTGKVSVSELEMGESFQEESGIEFTESGENFGSMGETDGAPFTLYDSLAPAGASLQGTNLVGYNTSTGVYYFEFRNTSGTLLTRYEINVSEVNVQKGVVRIKENITDSYPIWAGGTMYRNLTGSIVGSWYFAQSASVNFSHSLSNNILSLKYNETYSGITTRKQFDFEIRGKTLIIHAFALNPSLSANGNYMGFNFDRSANTPNFKNISLTYAETAPIVIAGPSGNRYFYSMYPDWKKSNSNYFPGCNFFISSNTSLGSSCSPKYVEGVINPATGLSNYPALDETLYVTVSKNIEDTIMKVNREPSKWRADLSSRPVIDIWSLPGLPSLVPLPTTVYGRANLILETLHYYGVSDYLLLYHYWSSGGTSLGYRSRPSTMCWLELPNSYPPANDSWSGFTPEFLLMINNVKNRGSLIALMQSFGSMFQGSPVWNISNLKRNSDGLIDNDWASGGCSTMDNRSLGVLQPYTIAMDKMLPFAVNETELMERDYNPTALYNDVTTKRWFTKYIDYSYNNTNSMTTSQAVEHISRIHDESREIIDGPLLGEGGGGFSYDRWIAGHTDGVEAEISYGKKFTPVLPHFELLHIKPLMANQGMGYTNRYEPRNTPTILGQESEAIINLGNKNRNYTVNGTNFTIAPFDFDRWRADTIIYGHTGLASDHLLYGDPFYWDATAWRIPSGDPRYQEYRLDFQKYFVKEYYTYKDLQNQYLSSNVTAILYRTPSGAMVGLGEALDAGVDFMNAQVRITYDNGLNVYVNRNQQETWEVSPNSNQFKIPFYLPPNGWLVFNDYNMHKIFLSYSGLVDEEGIPSPNGHRVDITLREDFGSFSSLEPMGKESSIFVDARGNLTDFSGWTSLMPLVTDSMVVIKSDGWNIIELFDNPLFKFAVGGPFEFNISTQNGNGTVTRGGSIQVPLNIVSLGGPNMYVRLGVSGLPAGATYDLSEFTCLAPCSPNNPILTINTSNMTAGPGVYNITVIGISGSLARNNSASPFALTVNLSSDTPSINRIEPNTVTSGRTNALVISGINFNASARVEMDGQLMSVSAYQIQMVSPTEIRLVLPSSLAVGSHSFIVVNPGNRRSNSFVIEVRAPRIIDPQEKKGEKGKILQANLASNTVYRFNLSKLDTLNILYESKTYSFTLNNVVNGLVSLKVGSKDKFITLNRGTSALVDLDGIFGEEVNITLETIYDSSRVGLGVRKYVRDVRIEQNNSNNSLIEPPLDPGSLKEGGSNALIWVIIVLAVLILGAGITYFFLNRRIIQPKSIPDSAANQRALNAYAEELKFMGGKS